MNNNLLSRLPNLYQSAFTRDQTIIFADRSTQISVVRAGTLHLPTGRIVLFDPLIGKIREPFVQSVLPGHYAVDLSLGRDLSEGIERILFSRIQFTKNPPVMWVKAFREDETDRGSKAASGIALKSGTAAYLDQQAATRFNLASMLELDQFLDRLVTNHRPDRSWLNHTFDDAHNAIFFTSYKKNGLAPTFFAIDGDGDICLALTSLFL